MNGRLKELKEFRNFFYWAVPAFSLVIGSFWLTACGERDIFKIVKESLLCGLIPYLFGIFFINGLIMDLEKDIQ